MPVAVVGEPSLLFNKTQKHQPVKEALCIEPPLFGFVFGDTCHGGFYLCKDALIIGKEFIGDGFHIKCLLPCLEPL